MVEYYRKTRVKNTEVPAELEVLWAEDGSEGRSVIEFARNLSAPGGVWDRMNIRRDDPGGYNAKLKSKRGNLPAWLLTKHRNLSVRDYLEIASGTARLKNGVIVHTDTNLIEESR